MSTLAEEMGLSKRRVIDLINKLEEDGWLVITRAKTKYGDYDNNEYNFEPFAKACWDLYSSDKQEQNGNNEGGSAESCTTVVKESAPPTKEQEYNNKKKTSEDKPRGEVSYPAEWYRKNEDDYQRIKGITLEGPEFAPLQQALKSMYMANRTPDQICDLMEAFERSAEGWTDNWTYSTVKTKMAEFVSGKLSLGKSSPASSNPHSEIIAQQERLRTLWNECSHNIKEVRDEAKRHNRSLTSEEYNQIAEIQDKQREYEERGLRLKERLGEL